MAVSGCLGGWMVGLRENVDWEALAALINNQTSKNKPTNRSRSRNQEMTGG